MSDVHKPKGKEQKGIGSKDARLQKRNKNVTSDLPDRQKEAKLEAEVRREMAESGETVFVGWQRAVIDLQLQGWSFEDIIKKGMEARAAVRAGKLKYTPWTKIPSRRLFFEALKEQPGYREACTYAFNFSVESLAQETVKITRGLDKVKGLKGPNLVDAMYKRVLASLKIAERRIRGWQDDWEGEQEVIVFEPYGGWVPTNLAKGAPGQGPEAEAAAERWKKMREEGEAVKGGGNG